MNRDLTDLLSGAELEASGPENGVWSLVFETPSSEENQYVALVVPKEWDYVLISAPIVKKAPDELSAAELRAILRRTSETVLSKVEVTEFPDDDEPEESSEWLVATSECALEGITATKLRNRIEACVTLAVQVRRELST